MEYQVLGPLEVKEVALESLPGTVCSECGTALPARAGFCPGCGAATRAELVSEERKVVTVLFADLVDSTAHGEQLDPEDVRAMLTPYFARVRSELERFGATVEKFIGDAVMALFGAPVAHEDDPERAVRAALAIREGVGELNEERGRDDLHVRIAVNTGEAVVALGVSPSAGIGLAAGDVINTCSRLQAAAPIDGILVGETTYHATAEAIEYVAAEPVTAKGKEEPLPVWEAVTVHPERLEGLLRRAPLVGRAHELDLLLDVLIRAREKRTPQLVSLVGVPGIGKTRLVQELMAAVESQPKPASWRHGRCLPYGDGAAFAALTDMVNSEAGILATDSAEEAEVKLCSAVIARVGQGEAEWVERHLRPVVGLEGERALGRDRRTESFAAWRRFFEALAQAEPLVLVFEDLHWADDELLDFVDELVEWVSGVPLLVVCTARPELLERRPDWGGGKQNAITLSLSPLSKDETAELVHALLNDVVLPEELETPLIVHAGGNALYAEEYTRMLADRTLLWRAGELADAVEGELPLPESVQGIIAARIDALAPAEKLVLQQAAVIGKVVWLGAVAEIAQLPRAETERCLHALERKEFVRREPRSSVGGEVEYWFRHVLIRDVAYAQLPRGRRAVSHRAAADWIESLARDREEHAELLVYHYTSALEFARAAAVETGDLVSRARLALREAGDRALALNAFASAARLYESALELEPSREDADPQLVFSYGRARFRAEHVGASLLAEARELLLAAGDRQTAAEAEVLLGELTLMQGDRDAASAYFAGAVDLLESAPPSRAKAYVLASLSRFLMVADENEDAIRVGREALRMAEELELDELRAHALDNIGAARIDMGDRGGLEDLERSVAIAVEASSPESVRSYLNFGSMLANLGDLHAAFELHAKGRQAAARFGDAVGSRWFAAEQIYEHYWRGDWEAAIELAEKLIREVEGGPPHRMAFDAWLGRAWIRLGSGNLEGAVEDADRFLEFARTMSDAQSMVPALALRARVLAAVARAGEASETIDELLADWAAPSRMLPSFWTADLAAALVILERREELAVVAAATKMRTRWLEAAEAFVARDFVRAADAYSEIGSLPDEAYARLKAATQLTPLDAEPQLAGAISFYRRVHADAYLREARSLAAARC
jgi:predicted ATPase/class 3 adenylate cyclase